MDKLRAKVAGGELAGNAVIIFPEQGSQPLRDQPGNSKRRRQRIDGENSQDVRGELTASLPSKANGMTPPPAGAGRRGRRRQATLSHTADARPVAGDEPLAPDRAALHQGDRAIQRRGRASISSNGTSARACHVGTGYLDFGTKQVRLNLMTDNPGGFKIPFITDLWQGVSQELLQYQRPGTVQDPKVQPSSMGVITTTIDQVFKGDAAKKQ